MKLQVVRLDGGTGEILSTRSHCPRPASLISADATGYVLQRPGSDGIPAEQGFLERYTY